MTQPDYIRTARKEHRCARQIYWDRLTPESRVWRKALQCPYGGIIAIGVRYAETEGFDEFHPTRQHIDCLEWTEAPDERADAVPLGATNGSPATTPVPR